MDLRNFQAAVWRFIGEQRDLHIDGGRGGLERDLQPHAVEQGSKLWLRQLRQPLEERQLVEGRREIGGGGRGVGDFLGQGCCPLAAVFHLTGKRSWRGMPTTTSSLGSTVVGERAP